MLKHKPGGIQHDARSIAFHIFFVLFCFPLQVQSHRRTQEEKKKTLLFFLLSQEQGAEGMRVEVGKHGKLQKMNKNQEKTKENPNKINTHTHRE